jgi:2-deoxy-D-gluconate 3-dehydrogenase
MANTDSQFQLDNFNIEGKVALVTGASRGLGAGMCKAFDRAGCRVVLVARSEDQMKETAAGLSNDPVVIAADIASADAPQQVISEALSQCGQVDILVNNAGIANLGPAHKLSVDSWDQVSNVNLRAAFLFAQAVAPGMIERGSGKIVNVASIIAFSGDAMAAAYTATKTGMVGLTRALAVEWAKRGIQVNALCPGWVDTDMTKALRANEAFENRVVGSVPQARWGEPEDMDGPLLFLSSPASDFMTGQTLTVDGGLLARW